MEWKKGVDEDPHCCICPSQRGGKRVDSPLLKIVRPIFQRVDSLWDKAIHTVIESSIPVWEIIFQEMNCPIPEVPVYFIKVESEDASDVPTIMQKFREFYEHASVQLVTLTSLECLNLVTILGHVKSQLEGQSFEGCITVESFLHFIRTHRKQFLVMIDDSERIPGDIISVLIYVLYKLRSEGLREYHQERQSSTSGGPPYTSTAIVLGICKATCQSMMTKWRPADIQLKTAAIGIQICNVNDIVNEFYYLLMITPALLHSIQPIGLIKNFDKSSMTYAKQFVKYFIARHVMSQFSPFSSVLIDLVVGQSPPKKKKDNNTTSTTIKIHIKKETSRTDLVKALYKIYDSFLIQSTMVDSSTSKFIIDKIIKNYLSYQQISLLYQIVVALKEKKLLSEFNNEMNLDFFLKKNDKIYDLIGIDIYSMKHKDDNERNWNLQKMQKMKEILIQINAAVLIPILLNFDPSEKTNFINLIKNPTSKVFELIQQLLLENSIGLKDRDLLLNERFIINPTPSLFFNYLISQSLLLRHQQEKGHSSTTQRQQMKFKINEIEADLQALAIAIKETNLKPQENFIQWFYLFCQILQSFKRRELLCAGRVTDMEEVENQSPQKLEVERIKQTENERSQQCLCVECLKRRFLYAIEVFVLIGIIAEPKRSDHNNSKLAISENSDSNDNDDYESEGVQQIQTSNLSYVIKNKLMKQKALKTFLSIRCKRLEELMI